MKIDMETMYTEVTDKVATVFFNRPPLNLFTLKVFDEFERTFDILEGLVNKDEVRAVVLTSAIKKAFSAGDDVKEGPQTSDEAVHENFVARAAMDKIRNFSAPVISAVDGYAFGGGLVLAMMADYVVAGERAKFGFTEINFGMFANWGTTFVLGRGFSLPHMKHLMFSGDTFGAAEALAMNIVQKVAPSDELLQCAQDQARSYASKAPIGVRAIKSLLNNADGLSGQAHMSLENYLTRITFDSEDVQEGTRAFAEKRAPVFRNK
jgi:enoyl-CoA hydratase/carnithine racemase